MEAQIVQVCLTNCKRVFGFCNIDQLIPIFLFIKKGNKKCLPTFFVRASSGHLTHLRRLHKWLYRSHWVVVAVAANRGISPEFVLWSATASE